MLEFHCLMDSLAWLVGLETVEDAWSRLVAGAQWNFWLRQFVTVELLRLRLRGGTPADAAEWLREFQRALG